MMPDLHIIFKLFLENYLIREVEIEHETEHNVF